MGRMEHLRVPKNVKKHFKKSGVTRYRKNVAFHAQSSQNDIKIDAKYRLKIGTKAGCETYPENHEESYVFEELKRAKVP